MAKRRLLCEFGMGSSLRRGDATKAAERALRDALWHNSINIAELYGVDKSDMLIDVDVGVPKPEALDIDALKSVFPYGQISIAPSKGGLEIERPDGTGATIIANVAIHVSLDLEPNG